MNKRQLKQYEMLARVRDFGAAQANRFPEATLAAAAFAVVGESVKQLEQYAVAQIAATRLTAKAKAEAKAALRDALSAMSQTARAIATVEPSFQNKFQLPKAKNAQALLTAGRLFVREAEPFAALFAKHALQIADFTAVVNRYEAAVRKREVGREESAGARRQIDNALTAGLNAARQLDAIVRNHIKDDTVLVAMWEHDRKVPYPQSEPPAVTPPASLKEGVIREAA